MVVFEEQEEETNKTEQLSPLYGDVEEEDLLLDDDVGDCSSFREIGFQSEEMKFLLKLEAPPAQEQQTHPDYHAEHLFPQWILSNSEWQSTECRGKGNKISEILQTSHAMRSQEQTSALIHWLMSVWKTAYTMGFKRCGKMTKVFQFLVFKPGQDIIVEGDKGLTFYIIISGDAVVIKKGIGQVATLHKGDTFGELALTEGNDRRSATIKADTEVEILQLHKVDYDHFVKDIQLVERRENLHVLRSCKLFENWPRAKVQKMCNVCSRVTFKPGETIYNQGDEPDKIYFIIEGQVDIYKEIYVVVRNRWPTGMKTWNGMARKKVKPCLAKSLQKDDYFGELIHDKTRTATAKAKTRCVVLALDRLEFSHLAKGSKMYATLYSGESEKNEDKRILEAMLAQLTIKGGPSTTAHLNNYVKIINENSQKKESEPNVSCDDSDCSAGSCESDEDNTTSRKGSIKPSQQKSNRKRSVCDTIERIENNFGNSIAHGVNVENEKTTEFTIAGSSPTKNEDKKLKRMSSIKAFTRQLTRTSSATAEIKRSDSTGSKSVNECDDSENSILTETKEKKKGEDRSIAAIANSLRGEGNLKGTEGSINYDTHLKIIVDQIVNSTKKKKYYDKLAELRFRSDDSEGGSSRRFFRATNGQSLKFAPPTKSGNTTYANNKIVYSHTKNLQATRKNPRINISDEASPVMTAIDSVVMKSQKGRRVRSHQFKDIECYVDATSSHHSLPPLDERSSRRKSKLRNELSSYVRRDLCMLGRDHTAKKEYDRQHSIPSISPIKS